MASGGGLRILVVDDYPDTVEVMCTVLAFLGHVPRGVTSGEDAIDEVARFAPDLVVIDFVLPGIDGCEVARRLRARPGRTPYLVALTGWGHAEDRAAAERAGFDDFVLKPADLAAVRRALSAYRERVDRSREHPRRPRVAAHELAVAT